MSTNRNAPRVISSPLSAGGRWGAPRVTSPETRLDERTPGEGDFCDMEPSRIGSDNGRDCGV